MHSLPNRLARFVAAICALVVLPASAFEATPDRQVGPTGTERTIGASIHGQGGWQVPTFDDRFDQGISSGAARSGLQSWRVSNWYSSGIVDAVRSPLFAPAAEATANAMAFQDFWFRVPAGNEGLVVSTSLSDGAGRRMSYLEVRVAGGEPRVMAVGVALGDNGSGTCSAPRPLLCDNGVDYIAHESPVLAHDTWYRIRITLALVAGERNDAADYRLFADDGSLVWQQLGVPSWEDLYWDSIYGSGQKVVVDRMQLRLAEDPDAAPGFTSRSYDSYGSVQQPAGLYIDDLAIGSAVGAAQVTSFEPDAGAGGLVRYVATTGSDAGNDCLNTAFPCRTPQHATASADPGDVVELATGSYVGPLVVDRTLTLRRGVGGLAPEITIGSGGMEQTLLTVIDATDVVVQGLTFDVDQSYVAEAIRTQGVASGLTINGNSFIARQSVAGVRGGFGRRNAVAVNLDRNDATLHGGAANIRFTNNTCSGVEVTATRPIYFRSCFAADAIGGELSGNLLTGGYYDAIVRFSTSPVAITGNTFSGAGLQLSENNANGHTLVQGNTFDPDESLYAYLDGGNNPIFFGDPSLGPVAIMLKLQNTSGSASPGLTIADNTFADHAFAIHAQNVAVMDLSDNDFTPRAGLPDFLHLAISNKVISSNSDEIAPRAIAISASGNDFGAEAGIAKGTAVAFWNHHATFAGVDATYGSLQFSDNDFAGDLQRYFALDPSACASSSSCTLPLAAQMVGTAGVPGTPVAPFAGSLSALGNRFGGVLLDGGASLAERAAVETRVFHRQDHPALGLVDLGIGSQADVYVDDAYAGPLQSGDPVTVSHGGTAVGEAYWQINAFASVQDGLAAVETGGTVWVARGAYAGPVLVGRHVRLRGDGSSDFDPANSTVIQGSLAISGSGASAADRLLLQSLRVHNTGPDAAGDGIRLIGDTSHVQLQDVASSDNAGHGLMAWAADGTQPSLTTDLFITGSHFDDNGDPVPGALRVGLVFDEGASVDGLLIEDSSFNGNNAAGLTFNDIGSPASQASIRNVTIRGSEFSRNNPADSGIAGGGIWLKTSAVGTIIENVLVEDSDFFDNGTGQTNALPELPPRAINANGISVRARPGTTLTGVRICGNRFGDTGVQGEQLVGVYVYDDTAGGGYQPVEICDNGAVANSFAGLLEGISGYEQAGNGKGRPAIALTGNVDVSGGTGWAHVDLGDEPAVYVDDAYLATFNGDEVSFSHPSLPGAVDAVVGRTAFGSIAEALLAVEAAGTVYIAAGTYAEDDLSVDAPVAMLGPQAGVDARDRSTADEAVVVRASTHPSISLSSLGAGELIEVNADGVVIDGLVLDGDNPALASGVAMNGADVEAAVGIDPNGNGLQLRNTIIRNVPGAGVYGSGQRGDTVIERNRFQNIAHPSAWGSAIIVSGSFYARIEDNLFDLVRVGVQTDNTRLANPGAVAPEIRGNVFHVQRTGIFHNQFAQDAAPYTIADNEFHPVSAAGLGGHWQAIWIETLLAGQSVTLSGNDVFGGAAPLADGRARVGYLLNNIAGGGAAQVIDGGNVSGVEVGVLATDATFYPGAVEDFVVRNVAFSGISLAAFYVEDANEIAGTARLTVGGGNAYSSVPRQAALSGSAPELAFADGLGGVESVRVRAAGNFFWGSPSQAGPVRTVASAAVNDGIAAALTMVAVDPGQFPGAVLVDKPVLLQGARASVHGDDPSRGTGESVLVQQDGETLLTIASGGVGVAGFELHGATAGRMVQGAHANVAFTHNRLLGYTASSSTGVGMNIGPAADWNIAYNLFQDFNNGDPGTYAMGVRLDGVGGASVVRENTFRDVQSVAIQVSDSSGLQVLDNIVDGLVPGFTNAGVQVLTSTGVQVRGNSISGARHGLLVHRGNSGVVMACNTVSTSHYGVSFQALAAGSPDSGDIFHNDLSGAVFDLSNSAAFPVAPAPIVGSNWYGSDVDATPTTEGALQVAGNTTSNPVGQPGCGTRAIEAIAATGGDNQSVVIGGVFAPLSARVTDAFGGAVPGQSVLFVAPDPSGASAMLGTALGSTDFNGSVSTTAQANLRAGTYPVTASAGGESTSFTLTNAKATGTVVWSGLEFPYTGEAHPVSAHIHEEPGTSCTISPVASVGPEVGTYERTASCTGVDYDADATTTISVGGTQSVHVLPSDEYFTTVAAALADEDTTGDSIVELAPGTYTGAIVLTKGVHLRGGGITGLPAAMAKSHAGAGPHQPPTTLVDGGGAAGTGITIASGVQGAEISGLEVTGFGGDCIFASQGNDGLVVRENVLHGCGGHGLQVNGIAGITNVVIEYNTVTDVGNRGIVVWNGAKRDILVRNNHIHGALDGLGNVVAGPFATAIAFEDGTATGITVVDNLIEDVGDAGITAVQLTSGSPSGTPNTISLNTIRNPGRFGIALMIPNGTGLQDGDGAIVVEGNTVLGGSNQGGYASDRAGISVIRRFFLGTSQGQEDATMGVRLVNNGVHGFASTGGATGYGIVVEGVGHSVHHNTLTGNDVGLQLQQGNQPASLPGNADVDDGSVEFAPYFDRGNAALTCASLDGNSLGGNTAESRFLPASGANLTGSVHNQSGGSWHCTINEAIAAAQPGDLLRPFPGLYRERVLVDKRVHLAGPWAGFHGAHPTRDGSGEAIIDPPELGTSAGTQAVRIAADAVVLEGLTITGLHGGSRDAGVASGTNFGALGNAAVIRNNRFVALDGYGVYTNTATGGGNQPLSGWQVVDNLFEGIGELGSPYSAVNLWKMVGAPGAPARVAGNEIRDIGFAGVQLVEGQHLEVAGNTIANTGANGINVGPQLSGGVQVHHNSITASNLHGWPTEASIVLFGGSTGADVFCNDITTTGGGDDVFVAQAVGHVSGTPAALGAGLRVFHNAIAGPAVIANGNSATFVVGSNWYANGYATGATGGGLLVADALDADPLLHPDCGDNDAVRIEVFGGDNQSATTGQAFPLPLLARVEDALGGAVPGQPVQLEAPSSGASAVLSPASGTVQASDHNGVVAAGAVANGFAGGYTVTAHGPAGSAGFPLENLSQLQVLLDLNGPVGGIEVGDTVAYTGRITNQNPDVAENVIVRVVVSGSSALDPSDVAMCVVDPGNPSQCHEIAFTDFGATLGFDFPDVIGIAGGFDISPDYDFTHQLRTVYGQAGVFTASAQVVGVDSQTVYASDLIATEVVQQHAGITLALDGPVAGIEKGAVTPYLARLTNTAADVADPVLVEFTISRDGGAAPGDLTVEYDAGGGAYEILPLWFDDGGDADPANDVLLGQFGPSGGFPLLSGHDATTAFRVTYHVAPHSFSVAATVIDAAGDSDGVPVYAADQLATEVIDAAADVTVALSGPFDPMDGTTLVAARVGEPVLLRASLANAGGPVPDLVQARFTIGASFSGIEADDLLASYWFVAPGGACAPAPAPEDRESVSFTDAGETLVAATTPQPLGEGMALDVCFELGLGRAGVYNIAAVIEDAAGDSDGMASYAADNLAFGVARALAVVSLDGAVDGLVQRAHTGAPQVVTASTDAPITGSIAVTYAGSATPPTAVGTYALQATLVDPDYEGVASGSLVIADAADITLALDPLTPMAFVDELTGYTGFVAVAGTIANAGPQTSQPVHTRITVVRVDDGNGEGGQPVAIALDDVRACVFDVEGHDNQAPDHQGCPEDYQYLFRSLGSRDGRPAVEMRYPNLPENDAVLGSTGGFAVPIPDGSLRFRAGEYRVYLDVVGSDGTVYASATSNTTSVPDASIAYSGPLSGPAEQLLVSQTTLRNQGGRSVGNVLVRVTLSDAFGATLTTDDAELFYQSGGDYAELPLVELGGDLVTLYGPPGTGFPLEDGHDATDAGAALFHRTGEYQLRYEVLDAATLSTLFASETVAFTIAANAASFTVADLLQTYDGAGHAASVAASPAHATFEVSYAAFDGVSCGPALAGLPVDAGSYCVDVAATGPFSGGASGILVIAPAAATVALEPGSLSVVFDGAGHVAQATTVPADLPVAFTYDGSSDAPVNVGSYTVVATVTDPNYSGGTSGILTISPADATLTLAGDATGAVVTAGSSPLYSMGSGTVGLSGPAPQEWVRAFLAISRPGGIVPGDLDVEYLSNVQENGACVAADGGGFWCPLPLSDNDDGTLGAAFGPGSGFPLADGNASFFRTRYHRGGQYHTSVRLDGVDSLQTYAIGSGSVDVAELTLLQTGPATAVTNTEVGTSSTLRNVGATALSASTGTGPTAENVIGRFVVSHDGGALAPADLALQYLAPDGSYQPLPLSACGDALCGSFGPPVDGFEVDAGYLATSLFRTVFSRTGGYLVETTIEGIDSGAVYAQATQAFSVSPGIATIQIDAASLAATYDGATHAVSVTTQPPGLSFEVTYAGDASAPVAAGSYLVEATITDPDFTGTATGTLVVAPKPVTIELANLGPHLYDGSAHPATASIPGLVAGDTVDLLLSYNGSATEPVDAGSYLVVASFDPALAPNYVALPAMAVLTIDKAAAGVSFGALGPFTYDGAPKPVAPLNPNGVALSIHYQGVDGTAFGPSAVPPIDAGSYQATATIDDPNHAQAPVTSGTFLIDPAGVTVSFGNLAQVYDGTARSVAVSTTPAGVAVDVAYAQGGVPATPINAGDYEVTGTVADPNYLLAAPASATLVIGKAAAQVTLSDLTQVYDGTQRPVTVATQPSGLVVDVTYDGGGTAPMAVGSYAVQATVDEPNYAGTASGTLTVLAAAIADFEVVGAVAFDGAAGAPLQGDLPTVRVLDAGGDGVPGVGVLFTAAAGSIPGVTGGQLVVTDGDGRATVAGWVLPADAGTSAMSAQVPGQAGLATLAFQATGAEVADIAVAKTSAQDLAKRGDIVDYTIVVTNGGPSNAQAVEVLDLLPGALDFATAAWSCTAAGGASCNGDDSGSGDAAVDGTLPVGGSLTIVLSAAIHDDAAEEPFGNTASVLLQSGADPVAGNDASTATVSVVAGGDVPDIFKDGFEEASVGPGSAPR